MVRSSQILGRVTGFANVLDAWVWETVWSPGLSLLRSGVAFGNLGKTGGSRC